VPGVLVNRDLVNNAFIGPDESILGGNLNVASILDALTGIPFDGTADVFACTNGPTVSLDYIENGSAWQPSPALSAQQIAALGLAKDTSVNAPAYGPPTAGNVTTDLPNGIAATGVPLLTGSTLVKNQGPVSQAPGATSNSATFGIKQIGYEILLTVFATGNFLSFYHLTLTWFDSATTLQTGQEDYWFVPGTGSGVNAAIFYGTGPSKGDQLVITSAVPAGSSVNVTHQYVVLQNSRIWIEPNWETIQFNSAGAIGTSADPTAGLLGGSSLSVGALTSSSRILPFFNGLVDIWANTGSGIADADFQIVDYADTSVVPGGSAAPVWEARTNANGFLFASQVALPAGQCQMILTNNNASGRTLAFTVVASRQR
jgi:hypothetical protein